jgi:hypothetical protein
MERRHTWPAVQSARRISLWKTLSGSGNTGLETGFETRLPCRIGFMLIF